MYRLLRLFFALVALTAATLGYAGEIKPYSASAFDSLTQAGKPVAIAVHASWCSTCKAQKPIQASLMADPAFKDITLLVVDFDGDQSILQKFQVRAQSTLIVFKGRTELGRSVGDTTRAGMAALFQRAAS